MDDHNHQTEEKDDTTLEHDIDTDNLETEKIGPAVGSLDPVQPTLDPDKTPSLDGTRDEEIADELTADDIDDNPDVDDGEDNGAINRTLGWASVVLAAISFFIMPIIFGAAGIIVGFIARGREDAKTLGTIAIIAGAAAILISFFVRPYM